MATVVIKAAGIWLLIAVVAIINGVFREKVLLPLTGIQYALPLSGILLSVLVFVVTYLSIPFIGSAEGSMYVTVGLLWVFLTITFEFVFGHCVLGKSWQEIVQVLNIMKGDLFLLVLITSAISPWVAAKLRGFL